MTGNISLISQNASEQASQISQVDLSVRNLDKSAKENSILVQENSSLADYLGEVAANMDELVGTFELGDCEADFMSKKIAEIDASTILVVDDNISNLKVATMILNKSGYVTKTANNGREAITQCNRYKPHAILMDIEMPVLNGLDATKQLRSNGYRGPIIAYTGHDESFDNKLKEAGMNDVIRKPVQAPELISKMDKHGMKASDKHCEAAKARRNQIIENSETANQYQTMINAHLGWKNKIRSFIDGADIGVTYEATIDPTACALGKWYYQGSGKQLMHLPMMKQLGIEHAEMHGLIKVVMDAFSIDDYETLENAVERVDSQSEKVVELLNELIDHEGKHS
jgi:methyl-accepting chemotaxis protein